MAAENTFVSPKSDESEENESTAGRFEQIIPGFDDVNSFTQQCLRSVLQATKSSNDLPTCGDDFDYYSSFESFRNLMDVEGRRILHLMQMIMRHQSVRGNLSLRSEDVELEDAFDVLTDANDEILERVGSSLDEASGVKKTEQTLVVTSYKGRTTQASWNKKSPGSRPGYRLITAHNVKRPQLRFKDKVDNSNKPFQPIIRDKPHALKSLQDSLRLPNSVMPDKVDESNFVFPHPYQYELERFTPLAEQLEKTELQKPPPASLTAAMLISTTSDLHKLIDDLKSKKAVAVDLEHHSYRTFLGFTCLMQISTRTRDYLIDTLELRSEMHLLNEVFTNPNIVKIFHGSDSDIYWLQRDFGLYVVNMFDTGQATRVLNYSRFSLAHLLHVLCQVTADKQYQLADWRIRPLPSELMKYAQEDTHYLLYIYDRLKNELIDKGNEHKNLLMSVVQRSTQLCAKVYRKPVLTEESHIELYHKNKKVFNSQQLKCLQGLYEWRDRIGRMEDESTGYVLPNHMLLQIADILPRERQGVLACCNPTPPLVRQCVNEIHAIVEAARETPFIKVVKHKVMRPTAYQHPKFDPSSMFDCPHDLSHQDREIERGTTLTTVLDVNIVAASSLFGSITAHDDRVPVREMPLLEAFSWKSKARRTDAEKKAAVIRASFLSPFEMYLPSICHQSSAEKMETGIPRQDTVSSVPPPTRRRWKMMNSTAVTAKTDEKKHSDSTQGVKLIDQPIVSKEEEDTIVPFVHQYQNPKKRKPSEEVPIPLRDDRQPKQKKEKVRNLPDESFKPYDYSKADMHMFQVETKKGKKVYDPDGSQRNRKEQKVNKSRLPPGTGKKSYTYNKEGKSSSKQHWPRR